MSHEFRPLLKETMDLGKAAHGRPYELVEVLRLWSQNAKNQGSQLAVEGLHAAADEIEQLRARVAELENKMSHDELLDKLIDPTLVWVCTTTKTVDIIDLPNGRGIYDRENPYFIRFEQLDSVCAFMQWLRHLAEKGWFTGMHVEQFSQCYELLLRNEIVPQRIYGKQLETDPEDLEHSSEP